VLIIAETRRVPIAASLDIRDRQRLCGRYWGALGASSCACISRPAITRESSIALRSDRRIRRRARVENQIARGLMPVETCSGALAVAPQFAAAVDEFLQRESVA